MKRLLTPSLVALCLGLGIGCGQVLMSAPSFQLLNAQAGSFTQEEQDAIAVTRRATPAVVGIQTRSGSGSGVIIRRDGVILTNAHVVGNAREVRVSTTDGAEYIGSVLGKDDRIDIAVVRVPADNLPAAPLADSDLIEVGQFAIAIGNPLGFERTVTRGIVSGLNRALGARLDELIQTDAAINPGNSGGPLLNSSGEVIGINTAVINPGIASGLGFAVPINLARDIAEQLLTTGVIRRAFLGVAYEQITREIAIQLRLPVQSGLIVLQVEPRTPAAAAGLQRGDIITSLDATLIGSGGDLRRFLRGRRGGDIVRVDGVRGSRPFSVNATLSELVE
jgi:serine protease Do